MAPLAFYSLKGRSDIHERCLSGVISEAARIVSDDYAFDLDENDESEYSSSTTELQKTVTFTSSVECIEVMGLQDYSEKELKRCWYLPEEKEKMTRNKDKLVARLEAGKPPKGDMTYQGLKCWTAQGGQELDDSIALVVNSVMDEQDRQWAINFDDFERIATISAAVTAKCCEAARETALEDERLARLAWDELDDIRLDSTSDFSNHSDHSNPLVISRAMPFKEGKKRGSGKGKKQSSKTHSKEDSDSESSRSSKSNKMKKVKKSKKSRRSNSDPPAPVIRRPSQDRSDILIRMKNLGSAIKV